MNCREFLIEFEDRGGLSEPATLHLTVCADCKMTSERQAQIWLAIDNFVKINAPNDFDFRVKARIVNAQPSDFQPRFLPVLRYVLPVAVVIALFGLIAFNSSYFSRGNTNDFTVAENGKPTPVINTTPALNNLPPQTSFAPPSKDSEVAEQTPQENMPPPLNNRVPRDQIAEISPKQRRKNTKENDDAFAGTHDSGITGSNSRIPKGLELNPNPTDDEKFLDFNGIKIAVENGKRTVKSIEPNNTAARSGIKVGDVIEQVVGDSIFVLRGTEKIEIKLQRAINQP